jgi:hypothetical protein
MNHGFDVALGEFELSPPQPPILEAGAGSKLTGIQNTINREYLCSSALRAAKSIALVAILIITLSPHIHSVS